MGYPIAIPPPPGSQYYQPYQEPGTDYSDSAPPPMMGMPPPPIQPPPGAGPPMGAGLPMMPPDPENC